MVGRFKKVLGGLSTGATALDGERAAAAGTGGAAAGDGGAAEKGAEGDQPGQVAKEKAAI
jgi:hypothetical protein